MEELAAGKVGGVTVPTFLKIVLGSSIFALFVGLVLGGLSSSGVPSMMGTHILFIIATFSAIVGVVTSEIIFHQNRTVIILSGILTLLVAGGTLFALDRYLQKQRGQLDALLTPSKPKPPSAPLISRFPHKNYHVTGSGNVVGNELKVDQGPCSNTQIGGSGNTATTNCGTAVMITYNYDGSQKKVSSGGSTKNQVNGPDDLYLKIQKEQHANQQAQSLSDAKKLMQAEPLWATPHILAGFAYLNLGELDAAKTELKKAKGLAPPGYEFEEDYKPHFERLEEGIRRHEPKPSSPN